GARVVVPTSLNAGPIDEEGWRNIPVTEEFAEKSLRIMRAYVKMGCTPTWTCAPYQSGVRPAKGEQVGWSESNAIVFANSVLGARTSRYGDYVDLCMALTGRAPKSGLHLTENRRGQILFRLAGLPAALLQSDSFYPVLGFYLGKMAGQKIPVLDGLPSGVTEDQLKALGAAAASSGCVALFHAVGITPEAPTLEAAFQSQQPEEVVEVKLSTLKECRRQMSTCSQGALDVVILGCPHFSQDEFRKLGRLVKGRNRHPGTRLVVMTSRSVRDAVKAAPFWPELERFGVEIVADACVLLTPMLRSEDRFVMTGSGKCAYYGPGVLRRKVAFGSLEDCVESAVLGQVCREESLWN
ncbi:MAG TPA: aconitase X catalytic domain-containing protein, partial [Chloroflexota bacterium]|nr:aconitase X catalytic domain-containing protein [Chloroflexota bacterium]